MSVTSSCLKLDLADGQRWLIRPVDERTAVVVAELGRVMRLSPGEAGRELYVAVSSESDLFDRSDPDPCGSVSCCLPEPTNSDMLAIGMTRIASLIAREALVRGGLLLHSALAEYQGSGFIMAGPGSIGKSTASRRLPSPWRSLCDDTTLIVRDERGRFWAHPWPTWSLFHSDGPGGSWAVERAVPLRAIFFLVQSPSDQLEPVNATQATALTLESASDLAWEASLVTEENATRTLCTDGVRAARALALAVPAYSLRLSLDGRFWEEIERVLPAGTLPGSGEDSRDQGVARAAPKVVSVPVESLMARDSLRVVYAGPSMNPTLHEPDLLEVKPYGTGRVRPGDVVCFKAPGTDTMVVHRVVAGAGGIHTRGDNSAKDDERVLQADDIIGRVKAAQRGARRRAVQGGWRGLMVLRGVRLGRGIRRYAGRLPHVLYRFVAGLGPFDRLLPLSVRPRLVRFDARCRVFLKLVSGRQTVGQYDDRREQWYIQRPFRLFVDEQTLRKVGATASRKEAPD